MSSPLALQGVVFDCKFNPKWFCHHVIVRSYFCDYERAAEISIRFHFARANHHGAISRWGCSISSGQPI